MRKPPNLFFLARGLGVKVKGRESEGLRSKIATSNEYKKGTQAGDLLSNVR
jgi:hypothetical protein